MKEKDAREIRRYKMEIMGDDSSLERNYSLIPYITQKPTPEAFNLPADVAERAAYIDERDSVYKIRRRNSLTLVSIVAVLGICLSIFGFGSAGYSTDNLFSFINALLTWGFIILIVVWPITIGINALITPQSFRKGKKKYEADGRITSLNDPRKDYQEYKKQLSMFEYWEKRRSVATWALFNEYELNESLAQAYRRHGYRVKTTHLFYGQHRELSLERDGKKTVVYAVKSGEYVDEAVVTGLAKNKEYDHAVIAALTKIPDKIMKIAKQNRIEVLDWQDIVALI